MAFWISVPNDETDAYQDVELDGIQYRLRTTYNELSGCWYIFLAQTGSGDWKIKTKATVGLDLLRNFRAYPECPQGELHLVDTSLIGGRVDKENFDGISTRFRLLYITVADLGE